MNFRIPAVGFGLVDQLFYDSPIGVLQLNADDKGIQSIRFTDSEQFGHAELKTTKNSHLLQLRQELNEYFTGGRKQFACRLNPTGTVFQKTVWNELTNIHYGNTVSYKYIAERIGNPNAVRAVGGANNKNPIPILVPCHRVIGANQSLVGYAGGTDVKQKLLELEGVILPIG